MNKKAARGKLFLYRAFARHVLYGPYSIRHHAILSHFPKTILNQRNNQTTSVTERLKYTMPSGNSVGKFLRALLAALAVGSLLSRQHFIHAHVNLSKLLKTYLLLGLKTLNERSKLAEDLSSLLVVFYLSSNELRQVAQRLGGVEDLCIISI